MKIVWAAVLLAIAAVLYVYPEDPSTAPVIGPKSVSAEVDGVSIRAWLQRSRVDSGQPVPLRLTFDNHSAGAVRVSVSDLQDPGFASRSPFRLTSTGQTAPNLLAIPAGGSITIESELTAAERAGRFSVGATVAITSSGGTRTGLLVVDPVEVTSELRERFVVFGSRGYAAIKDLTLPIILALVGYWLQRVQKNRETRQAVLTAQLTRMQETAETHYLPIVRSLRGVLDPPATSEPPDVKARYVYRVLLFWRLMRHLRDKRNSVFFKDRGGEAVAQAAWYAFWSNTIQAIGEDPYEAALKRFTLKMTYEQFAASPAPSFAIVRTKLWEWIDGTSPASPYAECLQLLHVLKGVFAFEANRPFDGAWYDSSAELEVRHPGDYIFPAEPRSWIRQLKEKLPVYYTSAQGYLRRKDWRQA